MEIINQNARKKITRYIQILFVAIAFALMVIVSYWFVSDIEQKHLQNDVKNAISNTESDIKADMLEPETILAGISETIRSMILIGSNADTINRYIQSINQYMQNNVEKRLLGVNGFYGIFDVFGGRFLTGDVNWIPPPDYDLEHRPFYIVAVEADGDIGVTQPYYNLAAEGEIITFVRRIFDDNDKPLGIICLNIFIERVKLLAIKTQFAENGYGFLLNQNMELIAHPDPSLLGMRLRNVRSYIAAYEDELRENGFIDGIITTDYRGIKSIVFLERLYNGWYMGIVTPYDKYYKSTRDMALFLTTLGAVLALALIVILLFLFRQMNRENEKSLMLANAKEHAEQSSRFKTQFLSHMSHEVRTPMNAILGITEIQLQNDALPSDVQEAFGRIYNSGYLLLGIINDILDLSKIEAGKLELTPINYDVPSLINDVVHLNIIRFDNKPIEFDLQVDEHIPLTFFGDELRIKQILNNLLSNAFKYTDTGRVSLSFSVEMTSDTEWCVLVFRVSDTGQGMTGDQLERLFNEYSRFNLEANRTTEGAGLGMNITKRLVELMNGEISVESEKGNGSIFTVRLPQKIVDNKVLGKKTVENLMQFRLGKMTHMKKAPSIVRDYMPYGKILVVDDVETNLYVAKGLMSPYGLSIETASSGFEAVEKIKKGEVYDVIFMDHFMPKLDGMEATKIIRGLGYIQPIVALTANAITGQSDVFLASGFNGFISKPIDIHQLNAVINKFVRDKYPADVVEAARKMKNDSENGPPQKPAVTAELLKIFTRDAENAAAVLETILNKRGDYDDEDARLYVVNVHAMKSALANIGEAELSAFASRLEDAGREKNAAVISEETPVFLAALRAEIEKNRIIMDGGKGNDADNPPFNDVVYLREKLSVIREACASYDKKTAKNTLSELLQKNWKPSIMESLDKISEQLLHGEFEAAAKLTEEQINA